MNVRQRALISVLTKLNCRYGAGFAAAGFNC